MRNVTGCSHANGLFLRRRRQHRARRKNSCARLPAKAAQIILIQELFETPYFCQDEIHAFFSSGQSR